MKQTFIKKGSFILMIAVMLFTFIACKEESFTVTFDSDGGSAVSSETVNKDDVANEPTNPTKDGFQFVYWYLDDADAAFDFSSTVGSDLTLTAKWAAVYTIAFDANGGSAVSSQDVVENEQVTEPTDPTYSEYIFDYWYLDDENTAYDFSTPVTAAITLTAHWTAVGPTDAELIQLDVEDFESWLTTAAITVADLALPSTGDNGTRFTWTTSDSTAITSKGVVVPNPIGGADKNVTLSLTAKNGDATLSFTYDVLVKAKQDGVITSTVSLPFTSTTEEYDVADGNLLTYFIDEGHVPYVNIEDYFNLLEGFIYASELEYIYDAESNQLTITYEVTYDNDTVDPADDETYVYDAVLDFALNTVYVEDDGFFNGYIYETGTDYSDGITYLDEYYIEEGTGTTFDLNAYRFDLIYADGAYVMPLHVANLLFASGSYYSVYYNGDDYKGIYAFGEEPETFRQSSLNDTTAPADVRLASFDFWAFTLDYLYGLKKEQGVTTYYDQLNVDIERFLHYADLYQKKAYSEFVLLNLDELHSSYNMTSFYESMEGDTPSLSVTDLGPRYYEWVNTLWDVQDVIEAVYPDYDIPPYRIISGTNTAIIYLDGFVTKSVDDDDSVVDSDDYMRDALDAMFLENPNIENIVVDLSYNTGGNVGALYRVMGYVTDEALEASYQNPLTGENVTYYVEVDRVARDVNWFFMTSQVTFSAANHMTALGKYQDFATIIGTTSGGGACSIMPVILPDGSIFNISSLSMGSYRTGNDVDGYEYHTTEYGIEPDYYLAVADLYNEAAIQALIESINAGTATPYTSN